MSYANEFAERVGFRADYKCEVLGCEANLKRKRKSDVARHVAHSATSFHIVGGPERFLVTDPPLDMRRFKGKYFPRNMFLVGIYNLPDDAFCVCPNCHRGIHVLALKETKRQFPDHKGKNAHWAILERITLDVITGKTSLD